MRQNNAGCLNAFAATFSRIMLLTFWIARPVQWQAIMGGAPLLACLGFLFLPFTTMLYVWLQASSIGPIQGWDYLWLALGVITDLATIASAGYSNRDRIPAGMPGAEPHTPTTPTTPTTP